MSVSAFTHSLGLRDDGTVWAWGDNGSGELGDGTTTSRSSPAQVAGLADIIAVEAGWKLSVALAKDGTVNNRAVPSGCSNAYTGSCFA